MSSVVAEVGRKSLWLPRTRTRTRQQPKSFRKATLMCWGCAVHQKFHWLRISWSLLRVWKRCQWLCLLELLSLSMIASSFPRFKLVSIQIINFRSNYRLVNVIFVPLIVTCATCFQGSCLTNHYRALQYPGGIDGTRTFSCLLNHDCYRFLTFHRLH